MGKFEPSNSHLLNFLSGRTHLCLLVIQWGKVNLKINIAYCLIQFSLASAKKREILTPPPSSFNYSIITAGHISP